MTAPPRSPLTARNLLTLPLIAAALLLQGCSREALSQPRPRTEPVTAPTAPAPAPVRPPLVRNVILISIDSLRADMPWAGYPRPIAPRLTDFAARAVTYTHAYALSSYTSQSIGGLLSGRLASELARDGAFFNRYTHADLFFPERLQAAGIRTLAAHTHFYFRPRFAGFEQGFDVYQMVPNLHVDYTTDLDITADRQEPLAERILGDPANTSGRFFAWFHFTDPHDRYLPHAGQPAFGHRARDLYDGEVLYTNTWVGRLLDFIARKPWAAQTAIIVTADHGEAFGEHGAYRHAFELWQPLVRVPLMVSLPGSQPRTIDANRSHVDLAPTILELLGVPAWPELRGTSLVGELSGGAAPERDVWIDLAETPVSHRRRALIHGRYKLIAFDADKRFEVFDLETDPGELHSLRTGDRATYDDMVARYRAGQATIHEVAPYGHFARPSGG